MDLRYSAAQEEFRAEARAWLEAHTPTPGSLASLDTAEGFEAHRQWERTLAADRWSVVSWPESVGGRGVGIFEWLVFEEEYWRARAPIRVNQNGIFLLAPTMFEFGTPAQQARFLPPMARSDEVWCQGWSEPDAGSDLAGIRSRAERDESRGGWVLNGQKTWASRGAFADWCFGLFRSDAGAERHRGLTYYLVPLDAPGVAVRPIPQIDGETGFAELFFEDVFVPDAQVLGGVGEGWRVAMATAGSERGLSLRSPARYTEAAGRLVDLWATRRETDPEAASRSGEAVAQAWIDAEAYRLNTLWTATRVREGGTVGPEASANKIHWSETDLAIHRTALDLLGPWAESLGDPLGAAWLDGYLFALAGPIYAGTNEIQRNVVAERLLGLPRG
ncbi:MAG: acyl-CoA dehydrogenase family protein [Acidimicrobiales bacterium]|nr:acyl-CoA dehydrogenase family protein [Acidimicrobiales bacterium]